MCFYIIFQTIFKPENLMKLSWKHIQFIQNVNSFSKKGFTPLWYSIRHCRWVWVIRTTEMHQSSGNGRGPTQYFIIFRPPWLRILHEECPVCILFPEPYRGETRSLGKEPPRNSWLTAGENPAKISCDMAIRDLASNRRIWHIRAIFFIILNLNSYTVGYELYDWC
jgi:hypothetical protein